MTDERPNIDMPSWLESWDEGTATVAYEEALQVQSLHSAWSDTIDTKAVATFTVASVILTVVPAIRQDRPEGFALVLLVAAGVAWVFAAGGCLLAFKPRAFDVGPNPKALLDERWLSLTTKEFRLCRMSEMGDSYKANRAVLDAKAGWLTIALWAAAAEVLALFLALLIAA